METVEVELVHHWTDRSGDEPVAHAPGKKLTLPAADARRLVKSDVAAYTTKAGATAAGDPEGRTVREAKAAATPRKATGPRKAAAPRSSAETRRVETPPVEPGASSSTGSTP